MPTGPRAAGGSTVMEYLSRRNLVARLMGWAAIARSGHTAHQGARSRVGKTDERSMNISPPARLREIVKSFNCVNLQATSASVFVIVEVCESNFDSQRSSATSATPYARAIAMQNCETGAT